MLEFEVVRLDQSNEFLKEEIISIRVSEYAKNFNESVNLNRLSWNSVDSSSLHYGIISNSKILSVLRLSFHPTAEDLEVCTKISTPEKIKFPVALLSRAATRSEFQNLGLHSLIRTVALSQCLQQNVHTVLGTLELSSLRFKQLQLIGYNVLAVDSSWKDSLILSRGPVALIGLIGANAIKQAIEKLKSRITISGHLFSNQHCSLE